MQSQEAFDLEQSNFAFSRKDSAQAGGDSPAVSKSKAFGALATFLIFLWGGTLLLSSVGATQPVAVARCSGVVFVALRVKHFRARAELVSKRLRSTTVRHSTPYRVLQCVRRRLANGNLPTRKAVSRRASESP